jgi:transposase InsO family protein
MRVWVGHDVRDTIVDFVRHWSERGELPERRIVGWIGVGPSKFASWKKRFGKVNEHNAPVPRDHWITGTERQAILDFELANPAEGYRRLAYMMLDADVVAVAPSTVYRVLLRAGRLRRWAPKPTKKGTGFVQPGRPHQEWHIDIAHINVCGTFYYLFTVLDGYSRFVVHWEIREQMREADVETILQRARERFPDARPTIISDNGPQFIAKDFKEFVRVAGMQHVRTSPYYPQSNGKLERWHASLKGEAIRPGTPLSLDDARRVTAKFVAHYNDVRLHSAIGYVPPRARLEGRDTAITEARDTKLGAAREARAVARQRLRAVPFPAEVDASP